MGPNQQNVCFEMIGSGWSLRSQRLQDPACFEPRWSAVMRFVVLTERVGGGQCDLCFACSARAFRNAL